MRIKTPHFFPGSVVFSYRSQAKPECRREPYRRTAADNEADHKEANQANYNYNYNYSYNNKHNYKYNYKYKNNYSYKSNGGQAAVYFFFLLIQDASFLSNRLGIAFQSILYQNASRFSSAEAGFCQIRWGRGDWKTLFHRNYAYRLLVSEMVIFAPATVGVSAR